MIKMRSMPILSIFLLGLFFFVFPTHVAHAQTVQAIIKMVGGVFYRLAPLFVGVAFLLFLVGVVQFIRSGGDAKARTIGRQFMIWGTVALFLMVCVWGIKQVLQRIFGIEGVASGNYPIIDMVNGNPNTSVGPPPPGGLPGQ